MHLKHMRVCTLHYIRLLARSGSISFFSAILSMNYSKKFPLILFIAYFFFGPFFLHLHLIAKHDFKIIFLHLLTKEIFYIYVEHVSDIFGIIRCDAICVQARLHTVNELLDELWCMRYVPDCY